MSISGAMRERHGDQSPRKPCSPRDPIGDDAELHVLLDDAYLLIQCLLQGTWSPRDAPEQNFCMCCYRGLDNCTGRCPTTRGHLHHCVCKRPE